MAGRKERTVKDKINIYDLYFGVVLVPMSYSSYENRCRLEPYNLFHLSHVMYSVALWVVMKPEEKAKRKTDRDKLMWLFGDVWARAEYEFIVSPWPYEDGDKVGEVGRKVDIFSMYVEPNADILLDMVDRVSVTSARRYLREWRKNRKMMV